MPSILQDVYCCCNVFPVTYGLYLIAFHCLLQGIYGVGVVVTSTHINMDLITNFGLAVSYGLLIPAGIAVLWTNLYESWKGARLSAIAILLLSISNLATAILYFVRYVNFHANSLLDKVLFWVNGHNWVDGSDYPFLFWHVLVFFLICMPPLWWYYAIVLYNYSKRMKYNRGKKLKLRLPRQKRQRKLSKDDQAPRERRPKRRGSFRRKSRERKEVDCNSPKLSPRGSFRKKILGLKRDDDRTPTPPKRGSSDRKEEDLVPPVSSPRRTSRTQRSPPKAGKNRKGSEEI